MTTHKLNFADWTANVRRSDFVVFCGGTFPSSFMLYEAILFGSIPVFILPQKTLLFKARPSKNFTRPADMFDMMPFADDGVEWSRLSVLLHESADDIGISLRAIESMDARVVSEMQSYLLSVRHRFLPENAVRYAIDRTGKSFFNKRVH